MWRFVIRRSVAGAVWRADGRGIQCADGMSWQAERGEQQQIAIVCPAEAWAFVEDRCVVMFLMFWRRRPG